jgi:hypothetical protein
VVGEVIDELVWRTIWRRREMWEIGRSHWEIIHIMSGHADSSPGTRRTDGRSVRD